MVPHLLFPHMVTPHCYFHVWLFLMLFPCMAPLVTALAWLPTCYSHSWLILVLCSHAWPPIYCSLVWVLNIPIPRLLVIVPFCCYLTSLLPPCLLFPLMVAPYLLVVTLYLCFPGWFSFPPFFLQVVFGITLNKQKQGECFFF